MRRLTIRRRRIEVLTYGDFWRRIWVYQCGRGRRWRLSEFPYFLSRVTTWRKIAVPSAYERKILVLERGK